MSNQLFNHKKLIKRAGKTLLVDEDKLDIFYTDPTPRASWQPTSHIKHYSQLRQLVLDIETSGLNEECDRILAIGVMDEKSQVQIFMQESESKLLSEFLEYFRATAPEVLLTYNGVSFDLPFIIARCQIASLNHPFKISSRSRIIQNAQVFGKPIEICEIFIANTWHVDVYICVLRWDFVAKTLTSRSLKKVVLQMGLRSEERLVLSHPKIQECWAEGAGSEGWQKIQEYLIYDLEDTKLIADKLVPSYWYESLIVPGMNLQQLAVAGNATKWQRVFERRYPGLKPPADPKMHFEGGLVISVPGLHFNIAKIDASSLYPSIMLKYGICSRKDTRRLGLSILDYLTTERLKLKAAGKLGDIAAKQQEGALKLRINSLFGFYGTGGVGFNDMEAAALIAGYGRRILRYMIEVIEKAGGIQVESDTDGVFFSHPEPMTVFEVLQKSLPAGINIELEVEGRAMFVPARGAKNYIIWHSDGGITLKGSWRKRDKSQLEKEFPLKYLTKFIESPQTAEEYYSSLKDTISQGKLTIEQITITRKVKVKEKTLLKLGKTGDVISFYQGVRGLTNTEPYSISYYLNLIAKKRSEILQLIAPRILNDSSYVQMTLSLF